MHDSTPNADPFETRPFSASDDDGKPTFGKADSDTRRKSGGLAVRCPNCHAPTEVAADTSLTDLTCCTCGSHFSLVDQSKATRMAPTLSKLGRFDLIERLGIGGYGSVWKARDKELDRTVAIKIPRQSGMSSEEQEQFFREARAAAQLHHPSIVSVHEVGRDGDSVYIVSDFVRGVTLGDWLTGQQLTSREAVELCSKIADALEHAHEHGVVHRDLKPANIIIDGEGLPHLMDFGLARREVGEVTVTVDGQVLGTPAYMSPEQAQGESHTADRRSDVYSLGVILFQLLTGELPFRGNSRMLLHQVIHDEPPTPRKLNSNISKDLETITLKCLAKEPNRRYQSARELGDELNRVLSREPIHARPIGRVASSWRWTKRNPRLALLTASVAVLLVTIAVVSLAGYAIAKRQQIAAQEAAEREAELRQLAQQSAAREGELRQLAEKNLATAKQAVDGYLTRVAEDPRLKQADFHKLRTELLETAVPFYERFAAQKPDDVQSEVNRVNSYARLASIHGEIGQHEQCVSEYEKAIALQNELASKYPKSVEYKRDLGTQHAELAWDLHVVGKYDKARPHYKLALSLYSALLQEPKADPASQLALAQTHERYGLLLSSSNDSDGATTEWLEAIKIAGSLVERFPEAAEYQNTLASSLFRIGYLRSDKDDLAKAVAIQRKLASQYPNNAEYRIALAESVADLGWVIWFSGNTASGRQYIEESVDIAQGVASQFPSVVKYREIQAYIKTAYGNILGRSNDWSGAMKQFEGTASINESLYAQFPNDARYLSREGLTYCAIARAAEKIGDNQKATAFVMKACAAVVALPADCPWADGDRKTISATANGLAWKLSTSVDDVSRNGKCAVELATKACDLTRYQVPQFVDTLAAAFAETGDFESAVKWSKKALELIGDSNNAQDPEYRELFSAALKSYQARKPRHQDGPQPNWWPFFDDRRDLTATSARQSTYLIKPSDQTDPAVFRIRSKSTLTNEKETDTSAFINIQSGSVAATPVLKGWVSARWILTPSADNDGHRFFAIQNQWKTDQYLKIDDGKLQCGPIATGFLGANWNLEPSKDTYVKIKNHANPNLYLLMSQGKLEAGPIDPKSDTAEWEIRKVVE